MTAKPHFLSQLTNHARCGRLLVSRAPAAGSIITDDFGLTLTSDPAAVKCRHCLRAMGLLPAIKRQPRSGEDEETGDCFDEMGEE